MDDFAVKSQKTLEFDKIRSMLAAHAVSDGAKSEALEISPFDNPLEINIQIDETNAALGLMSRKGSPTFGGVKDLSPLLVRRARRRLSMAELCLSRRFCALCEKLYQCFRDDDKSRPVWTGILACSSRTGIWQSITDAILSESEIADSASAGFRQSGKNKSPRTASAKCSKSYRARTQKILQRR